MLKEDYFSQQGSIKYQLKATKPNRLILKPDTEYWLNFETKGAATQIVWQVYHNGKG